MEESFIEFFASHKRAFLALHLVGVAVGMGGATITDILFFNFLRDFRISHKEAEVMRILSNAITAALGILYVSGIALFLSDPSAFMQSSAFLAKACIVVILTVNGMAMHRYIAPHMVQYSFLHHPPHTRRVMHRMRGVAFAMGAISFVSWYSVFAIAMLKSYFPATLTALHMIGAYLGVLCIAILVSQHVHWHLHRRSQL